MLVRKKNPTHSCGCKHKLISDITGRRFGMLIAEKRLFVNKSGSIWQCKCDCGNTHNASLHNLNYGTLSCGCHQKSRKDITNQRFGRLTAIERVEVKNGNSIWKCKCDCGNYKNIYAAELKKNGIGKGVKSCGCLKHELCVEKGMILANNHSRCRREFILNEVKFKSGYEFVFAEYLTSRNIKWEYEPRRFNLSSGVSYTPDFFLPEKNEWIEVKGYLLPHSEEKINLLEKEYGIKIKMVYLEEILVIKPDYLKWIRSIPIKLD
jgi:hypothetical protein